jgi:hypothetical protein
MQVSNPKSFYLREDMLKKWFLKKSPHLFDKKIKNNINYILKPHLTI